MSGTIAFRLLLVFALIVTAHTIKPFSIKSVTQHLVYSTRSFSFILPDQTRASFYLASDLALNLSNRLFEVGGEWMVSGDEGLLLAAQSAKDSLRPALKIWPPDEAVKPCRKPKSSPKRSAPAKRIERGDRNEVAVVAAPAETVGDGLNVAEEPADDVTADAVAPVVLPVIHTGAAAIHTFSVGFLFSMEHPGERPGKTGCDEPVFKSLRLAAGLEVLKRPRIILLRAEKPATAAPECEGEKPDTGETEIVAPVEEAPEPEEAGPPVAEEAPGEERPSPLKCPTQPEI